MSLIFYELKKIIQRPIFLISIFVFLIINLYNIMNQYSIPSESQNMNRAFWKVYETLKGDFTKESIDDVVTRVENDTKLFWSHEYPAERDETKFYTGSFIGDMTIYGEHKDEMERIYTYNNQIQRLRSFSKENIIFFQNKNSFEMRKNKLINSLYGNRKITQYYWYDEYENYFTYDFSSLLILLLLLLCAVPVFVSEHESKMDSMLYTCKHGRKATVRAKIFAIVFLVFCITLLFSAADMITYFMLRPFISPLSPVYCVKLFAYSPLTISILGYILFSFLLKVLGILTMAFSLLLISAFCRNSVKAFIFGAFFLLFTIVLYNQNSIPVFNLINSFNPISLIFGWKLFSEFAVVDLFSFPIFKFTLAIGSSAMYLFVVSFSIVKLNKRRYSI